MKILFVEQQYVGGPLWDGVGAYTIDLTRQLARAGHEVHVLSCLQGQEARDSIIDGVHVHYRGEVRIPGLWRFLRLPGVLRVVQRILRGDAELFGFLRLSLSTYLEFLRLGIDVDVIEASTYPRSTLLFALFRPRPLVLTAHSPGWQAIARLLGLAKTGEASEENEDNFRLCVKGLEAITAFQARRPAVFTVPSPLVLRAYAHEPVYSSMVADMKVAPYSVWPDPWLRAREVRTSRPVVLQVGRLELRKATEVLVDAGAELAADFPDLQIVFVGRAYGSRDGLSYDAWLPKRADDRGSPCQFIAEVGRDELLSWYGKARVVALPSWFDTFPAAGLEALAAGRPVVCTEGVGYADLIDEAGSGAVVPVGDAVSMAAALRPYLVDRNEAAQAGSAARALVTQGKLSEAATLGGKLAVYEEAIAKSKGR